MSAVDQRRREVQFPLYRPFHLNLKQHTMHISPIRCLALFGEYKDALTPGEAKRYRKDRHSGKHTYGSRPFMFHRNKRTKLRARKLHWHNLQTALQRVSKAGKPTCANAAQMKHWQRLMRETGMPHDQITRISAETWQKPCENKIVKHKPQPVIVPDNYPF